jgi:hypothetical protein
MSRPDMQSEIIFPLLSPTKPFHSFPLDWESPRAIRNSSYLMQRTEIRAIKKILGEIIKNNFNHLNKKPESQLAASMV